MSCEEASGELLGRRAQGLTLWGLRREPSDTDPFTTPYSDGATGDSHLRIRCPRCRWHPRREARWSCTCGHIWNTFDTGGVCPGCGKVWDRTQCLRCQEWSRHDAWYVWEENTGEKR